jgi:hypothetical protein
MTMSKARDRMLSMARKDLGYGERADGTTKQGSWYMRNKPAPEAFASAPWCQMSISYWANLAGIPQDVIPWMAYTPWAAQWFKDRGRFGQTPRVGAIVWFDWAGSTNIAAIDHVELVEAVRADGSIVTIGGNVANAVRRQVRRAGIAGYGYPDYASVDKADNWMESLVDELPLLKPGAKGTAVKRAFYLLGSHGPDFYMDPKAYDDTVYSPAMADRVAKFQKAKGLKVDREIGKLTWTALIKP